MNIKETIMLVEDREFDVKTLTSMLGEYYKIVIAKNGMHALSLFPKLDSLPKTVLLNNRMPMMDGYETCKLIKNNKLTKNTEVIFMSNTNCKRENELAYKAGASDYVTKPVIRSELLAKIKLSNERYDEKFFS